jgi:hypothetical protein
MKELIETLINQHPKTYSAMIKSRPEMHKWVMENSTATTEHLPTHIFSAINGVSNVCPHGNHKKLSRWGDGRLTNCGHVNNCVCTKAEHSEKSKAGWGTLTDDKKAEMKSNREKTMTAVYGSAYNLQRDEVKEARFGKSFTSVDTADND